jgi:Pilus assembly protein, PilO
MNMTGRDRKILIAIVPLLVIGAYWFLLLSPKREEASKAAKELTKQETRRDKAEAAANALAAAKTNFASDYAQLVKLGKAVPTKVDMPTVIVQLESAAKGTGITFSKIATGDREQGGSSSAQPPAAPGKGGGSQPAAAGGQAAQSGPGKTAETAGNSVNNANNAAEKSGVASSDTQPSKSAKSGGLPVGGGAAGAGAGAAGGSGVAGLDSVPLDLEFRGSFFRLADFFHRMKRFVRVANERIRVSGRLLTVESLSFKSDPENFPRLKAELKATVYLSPQAQGGTAGATPQGPAGSTPASAPGAQPASPPTATATP